MTSRRPPSETHPTAPSALAVVAMISPMWQTCAGSGPTSLITSTAGLGAASSAAQSANQARAIGARSVVLSAVQVTA